MTLTDTVRYEPIEQIENNVEFFLGEIQNIFRHWLNILCIQSLCICNAFLFFVFSMLRCMVTFLFTIERVGVCMCIQNNKSYTSERERERDKKNIYLQYKSICGV